MSGPLSDKIKCLHIIYMVYILRTYMHTHIVTYILYIVYIDYYYFIYLTLV